MRGFTIWKFGEIKICENCGEDVYLECEENTKICPKCGGVIYYFKGGD